MRFNLKDKNFILFYFIKLTFILFLTSCRANPHLDPPIQGDISVTLNATNHICFKPNFKDARIGSNIEASKPYDIKEAEAATFELYIPNGELVWELVPSQPHTILKTDELVCIGKNDQRFREIIYKPIVEDQKYGINMRANTTDNSRRVFFSTKFFYKDNLIKYSE